MRKIISFLLVTLSCGAVYAQKQTFDVISYTLPKGWQQKEVNGGRQLAITDGKTGEYAMALLIKSIASNALANDNFTNYWNTMVRAAVTISEEPAMQAPVNENGWDIVSGSAGYTDGSNKGVATLLSATGGGQTAALVAMTNTNKYQPDLLKLINSLELSKAAQTETGNSGSATTNTVNNTSISGLWTSYVIEKNAYQQVTAGYLRKEYLFKTDGTYIFRLKNWLVLNKDIIFIYETGTYSVNGHQLTIIPNKGRGEFWSKAKSGKTDEWGGLVKSTDYKPEKVTYTIELIEDPTYGNSLVLKPGRPTERDGGKFNAPGDPYEFHYSFRKPESLIDNPPGFKK
ncbi:hypothetical protein [Niabella hirudinis]|uniref:hypothetical protein n=1 Tax=Niabella hirudinis TaxID=1285929 RepID=UPI003EBF7E3D